MNAPQDSRRPKRRSKVSFAVGTPDGPRSAVWDLWATGDDLYLSVRYFGGGVLKVSLHPSGDWRYAFTKEYAQRSTSLIPPGRDRVIDRWGGRRRSLPPALGLRFAQISDCLARYR